MEDKQITLTEKQRGYLTNELYKWLGDQGYSFVGGLEIDDFYIFENGIKPTYQLKYSYENEACKLRTGHVKFTAWFGEDVVEDLFFES
jgi:hypothetical protein